MFTDRVKAPRHGVNLWIVPLKMSLAAVLLFGLTLTPDVLAAHHYIHLPNWFTMGGIDDARAILGAMLACVSTVLALIFSVALLVLSMVANLFGPRLLYRFVQDWVTQVCIGLFMGAFIYVFLVFLVTHQDEHSTFIPQVSLITSWCVVLSAFSFLVFYSHRVAALIQNPDAIGRIVDDIRRAVQDARRDTPLIRSVPSGVDRKTIQQTPVLSLTSGYLQEVDDRRLVTVAAKRDATIRMLFRPGQFILKGETLAIVSMHEQQNDVKSLVQAAVVIGRHRVLFQDIEFGIAQIVEIAIRALSPAINDTFTGIACVDLLGETLTILIEAPQQHGKFYDADGLIRLQVRPLLIPRLIRQGFDQIRQAASDNPAVLIRILSTIRRIAPFFHRAEDQVALFAEAEAVWQTAGTKHLVDIDRRDVESAWRDVQGTVLSSAIRGTIG